MSDPSRQSPRADPRVQAALREYLERIDRGEVVNREEFLSRHSEIADALRSFFAAEEPLRKIAATKISDESAGISTRSIAAQGQETVPPKLQPGGVLGTTGSGLAGKFGRYQILRALGKGAMGAVYLAQDTQLKRHVAIKTPHFEEDPTGELLKRFYREAEAAATLRHANICPVYDVGNIDGKHFISMAYIEGRPLSDLIKSGKPQNERHILIAVYKVARALQQAHDHGIVHRDLKPANIMVDKQGEPIIMDFGLARKRRAEGEASLTHSGVILGSPAYMSPEQIEGDPEAVGPATDQYSLGVVLYEMLTGQLPFRGSVVNVLAQIITKGPTPPSELRSGLDPRIEAVCLRMMAKKASDRFPSMKAVADQLAAIVKNPAAAPVPSPIAAQKSLTASRPPAVPRSSSADAGASQIGQSLNQRSISPSDVTSIEELVRKCLRRRDYDQMIQIIERIPEDRRNTALQTLLEQAREKLDEIAFLICELDEADRLGDRQTALRKAEALLTIKPGHHRAKAIQEKYAGYGNGAAARIGILRKFTQPWNEGGWIPWTVLAFGLAVFAGMYGVIVISLGNKTAIVIDAKDPGITVEVNDRQVTINVPGEQSIQVEPGDESVKVSYAGLETVTKSFTLAKGKTKRLTVRLLDNKLLADLEGEIPPTIVGTDKAKNVGTAPAEPKGPSPRSVAAASPVTPANPPPQSDGFVPLFNGKDLTGWKVHPSQPGNWRVENGVLIGSGPPEKSHLYTERGDFKNFDLRVEARINDGGNSGLYFRSTFGPAWPTDRPTWPDGYEAQIDSTVDRNRTGSLFAGAQGVVVGYSETLVPAGQWFTEEVIAEGNRLTIKVNGQTTATYQDEKRISASGHIALQQNGSRTIAEFRKIEIKELTAPSASTPVPANAPDRRAALAILGVGGMVTIRMNDQSRDVRPGQPLPDEPFLLTAIRLHDKPQLRDSDLEPLEGIANLRHLSLNKVPHVTDRVIVHLRNSTQLESFWFEDAAVGDAGLAYLEEFTALKSLGLRGTHVTDAGMAHVEPLRQLEHVALGRTRITSAGLVHLQGLSRLARLWLERTKIGDSGLVYLERLSNLKGLILFGTRVTGAGLVHLQGLIQLEHLMLGGLKVTNTDLASLEGLTSLKSLWLDNTRVTDDGLVHLERLTDLQDLRVNGTRVSDAGLEKLKGMAALRMLNVVNTQVTAAGVAQLKQSLPQCEIQLIPAPRQ